MIAAAFAVLGAIDGAAAQQQRPRRPLEATAPFWREVIHPGCARGRTLLRHAIHIMNEAEPPRQMYLVRADPVAMQAAFENAIERLLRAQRHCRRDPEIAFVLGHAYSRLASHARSEAERFEAAGNSIAWLHRSLEIEPEYEPEEAWFYIAIARSHLHDFAGSAEAYHRSIAEWVDGRASPTTYSNLAEMTMLTGDLEGAVRWYQASIDAARRLGESTELAEWGLAVALDRLGEHDAAVGQAWRAMSQRAHTLDALSLPYVFFEPAHEKDWYLALGHLARAAHGAPEGREEALDAAAIAWLRYVDADGGRGLFGAIARDRLQRTRAALGQVSPAPPRGTSRRR